MMVDVDEGRNDDALLLSLLFAGNTSLLLNRIDVAKENVKKLLWNRIGMIIVLSSMGRSAGVHQWRVRRFGTCALVLACCFLLSFLLLPRLNFQKISGLAGRAR
jgi:hypothetical protein